MDLKAALEISAAAAARTGTPFKAKLACGFTPLSLTTFLSAHLSELVIDRPVHIGIGPYGDLVSALEDAEGYDVVLTIVEYADLDPRFGLRRAGGWTVAALDDALGCARLRLAHIKDRIAARPHPRLVVLLPTLPLPPLAKTGAWQGSSHEMELERDAAIFAADVAALPGVVVCQRSRLDGALDARRNVNSDLAADFPYNISHTDQVARLLARNARPPQPFKGLITDLDDTLWRGVVGDVGRDGIVWDLDHGAQIHALYQMLLRALAERGILLAIASKNDLHNVEGAMARADLLVPPDAFFPIEASWNKKSAAVARILESWNIGADAVIFVDDSPMELAEVGATFPTMTCLKFPTRNDREAFDLLCGLRNRFHLEALTNEDVLRSRSIRNSSQRAREMSRAPVADDFLKSLHATITIEDRVATNDGRPLNLVNKTNQFNLNGRRLSETEWLGFQQDGDAVVRVASYADKFGPLGKVSVLFGRVAGRSLDVDGWVLSCRAFGRRIEFAMLRDLFESYDIDMVRFAYCATEKNGPFGTFLAAIGAAQDHCVRRDASTAALPEIFAEIDARLMA